MERTQTTGLRHYGPNTDGAGRRDVLTMPVYLPYRTRAGEVAETREEVRELLSRPEHGYHFLPDDADLIHWADGTTTTR